MNRAGANEIGLLLVAVTAFSSCAFGGKTIIDTAIIYDDHYEASLPSFEIAINESSLDINLVRFKQSEITNIEGKINAAKVSSLFILTRTINCTAMIELKRAITIFFIGMMKDHCDPTHDFLLYMFPSHYDVMQSMYDGIQEYGWKTAAVFYDGSSELAFGYQDLDLARQRGVNLKVWVIPEDEDETWAILKSVRLLGYRTYILACNYKVATSVINKAVFLSMVSEVNHWVIPNLETHPVLLQDFLESSVRLTLFSSETIRDVLQDHFRKGSTERVARDAVITAITKKSLHMIADSCKKAIADGCFNIPLSDDKQCGIDQGAKSVEKSENFYSLGTCTEIYMRKIQQLGATKIEYLEHHLGNAKGTLSFVGFWKENFEPEYVPFVQAAIVFPEKPLVVGIVYDPPWLRWHVNENTNETTFEGFLMDLLLTLSSQLNFKYKLFYDDILGPPENRPNDSNVNDEVNRLLDDDQVQFFLQKRPIHGGNLEFEELSIGVQRVAYYMVSLASGNVSPVNIWQFLAPFTFDSWAVLWASLVLVSGVLALVNHFNPFEWRKQALDETNDDVGVENFNKLGIGNSIWMAYAGVVHQGVDVEPLSYAGRIITGTWWYFTMLVIAAYTANLTAFLTQELSGDIETLDDLMAQAHYSYGVLNDSDIVQYFFPYATTPPFSTAWSYLQERPEFIFNTSEDILARIDDGGFYYLASFGEVAKVEQSGCDYARLGTGFWEYQYGLPFQLGSRYTAVFNDAIASLRDDGTLQELEEKWFQFRSECTEGTFDIESNRLGIDNLGGMFIFLVIGTILAMLVHAGEVAWSKRFRFKKFREMKDKKVKKDDPVTEMRRRREQERKELDEKIEAWEGGYDYWMNRMENINRTLKVIDEQNKRHEKQIRAQPTEDSDDEEASEKFTWWTNAFKSAFTAVRLKRALSSVANLQKARNENAAEEEKPNEAEIVKPTSLKADDPESGQEKTPVPGNPVRDLPALAAKAKESLDENGERQLPRPRSSRSNSRRSQASRSNSRGAERSRPSSQRSEASRSDSQQSRSSSRRSPHRSTSRAKKIKKMISFSQRSRADNYRDYKL